MAAASRRRFMTASQSLQHLASEAELKNNAKRRSNRVPEGLSAKTYQQATYQQAPADEDGAAGHARSLRRIR